MGVCPASGIGFVVVVFLDWLFARALVEFVPKLGCSFLDAQLEAFSGASIDAPGLDVKREHGPTWKIPITMAALLKRAQALL